MNNAIRYDEEYRYNLDCEYCCNEEGTCIGCEAEIMDREGDESMELEYKGILSDINSASGSILPCIDFLLNRVVKESNIRRDCIEYVVLAYNEMYVVCKDDSEHTITYSGEDILGLSYNEFVLRLNNTYRGLVNLREGVPFTYEYVLPLDGCINIIPEGDTFSFSYLHGEGDLIRDISPYYLKEYYRHFLWLDRYHLDIEYHLYGHETPPDSCLSRWYDLGYMVKL